MAGRDLFAEPNIQADVPPISSMAANQPIDILTPKPKKNKRGPVEIFNEIKEQKPVDFDLMTMIGNIPSSAKQVGSDIVSTVMNPIDTAKGLGNLAMGGLEAGEKALTESLPSDFVTSVNKLNNSLVDMGIPLKRLPENQEEMTFENKIYADNFVNFIDNRYGSKDAFKQTLMNDPVGVISDITGAVSGGSMFAPKASKLGKLGQKASMLDPANLMVGGAKKAILNAPVIKNVPEALYKSAAKFYKNVDSNAVTKTALENKIMPTSSGIDRAQDFVDAYDGRISQIIDDLSKSGKKVSKRSVFKNLKDLRNELGGVSIDAVDDLKKINKVAKKYDKGLKAQGKDFLDANDLQKLKRSVYKSIDYKKKQFKGSRPKEKAYKAIASAARSEIEKMYPEIKNLNASEGAMIDLLDAIESSAARIENMDLVGIGAPIKGMVGSQVGGIPGFLVGVLSSVADSPTVKAKLAIALSEARKKPIQSPMRAAFLETARVNNLANESQE